MVIGVTGDNASPMLVLGLRHGDQELHHLGRLGVSSVISDARALHFAAGSRVQASKTSPTLVTVGWIVASANQRRPKTSAEQRHYNAARPVRPVSIRA